MTVPARLERQLKFGGTHQSLIDVLVTGGTYIDRVCLVGSEPLPGHSIEIREEAEILGGPGLCLALAFRRLGNSVGLATALASCDASKRAAVLLAAEGISLLGCTSTGSLDRSHIYVGPTGERIVFNSHSLSGGTDYAELTTGVAGSAKVIAIASPTPMSAASRIAEEAGSFTPVAMLLHTTQLREVINGYADIPARVDLICMAETDVDVVGGLLPAREGALVVTTKGSRGAAAQIIGGGLPVEFRQSNVVATANANGAGEAFFAGLISWLIINSANTDWPPPMAELGRAIEYANNYAAAHILAGADLAFPAVAVTGGDAHEA